MSAPTPPPPPPPAPPSPPPPGAGAGPGPRPVRVVLLADTHDGHEDVRVPPCDLLVHAGDVTESGLPAELERFLAWLERQPARTKVFVAGNHDFICEEEPLTVRRLARERGLVYLEDEAAILEGLRIFGSPVTPRFCDLAFNRDRGAQIRAHWDEIEPGLDLLVTHGPPSGVGDLTWDGRSVGCVDLLAAIERARPRVHVCGHIHEAFGARSLAGVPTRFFNAALGHSSAGGRRTPFLLEIEPGGGRIEVVSGGESEEGDRRV